MVNLFCKRCKSNTDVEVIMTDSVMTQTISVVGGELEYHLVETHEGLIDRVQCRSCGLEHLSAADDAIDNEAILELLGIDNSN